MIVSFSHMPTHSKVNGVPVQITARQTYGANDHAYVWVMCGPGELIKFLHTGLIEPQATTKAHPKMRYSLKCKPHNDISCFHLCIRQHSVMPWAAFFLLYHTLEKLIFRIKNHIKSRHKNTYSIIHFWESC